MGKAPKSVKKFAASGKLRKTIQARRKHQQIKKRVDSRRGRSNKFSKPTDASEDHDSDIENKAPKRWAYFSPVWAIYAEYSISSNRVSVDEFLGARFMETDEEDEDGNDHDEQACRFSSNIHRI